MWEISVELPDTLAEQAESLAQRLDFSRDRLIALAPERVIHQGDVYWVQIEPGIPHPHVVLQADVLNPSRLTTVVVCALTSNLKRASLPGNVLLDAGEANLPRPSVVEVSKVSAVEKTRLGEYLGSLAAPRVTQILAGMEFLQRSFFAR